MNPANAELNIGILNYPGAMSTAVHGLSELFFLTNRLCARYPQVGFPRFSVSHWPSGDTVLPGLNTEPSSSDNTTAPKVLIIPPAIDSNYYENPESAILLSLRQLHQQGAIMCSACAGAFILAATGLLDQRQATTHWALTEKFETQFPQVKLNTDLVLINDGDVITAGGLMSWMDLGLELVAQFTQPSIMVELGKFLVIDTGYREQRYYKSFIASFDHGDAAILKAQHYIQKNYPKNITIKQLAEISHLGERSFLRKFHTACGYKPTAYIQNIRIQQARVLIETTRQKIEQIAWQVGYEDASAFRKIFKKLTGLSPRAFRMRFLNE